jgi:hypothetical protein
LKNSAETRLFIGGEFVDAVDGGTFDNICPVDGSRSGLTSGALPLSRIKHKLMT